MQTNMNIRVTVLVTFILAEVKRKIDPLLQLSFQKFQLYKVQILRRTQ